MPVTVASGAVPAIAAVSTGCGDTSTNTRCPEADSIPRARPNSTGARRLPYQYPASAARPSSHSPVTAETIGILAGPGLMPASAARSSSLISSTCGPCEA